MERFSAGGPDFPAVATPGAGTTTCALAAALADLAAAAFGLHLDPDWSSSAGALPVDMHGIVTTYQQVSMSAPALAGLCRGAVAVFDEIHHAGDERVG